MSVSTKPLQVLVVDDDDGIASLLELTFAENERFSFAGRARDGREALELTQRIRPGLLLIDLHMPVMGGVEATRAILAADPDACIVAFSSSTDPAERQAALDAGAVGVLAKPFDPEALLDAIERHAALCEERSRAS